MPLIIPKDLPAYEELQQENVFVMHQERAMSQHIRPLRILILNLMPTKIVTETQLARLLANSPLQVQVTFLQTATHSTTHTAPEHMKAFYKTFDEIKNERFDGMIITARRLRTWTTRTLTTGTSSAASWTTPRRTSTPPSTCAGVRWRGCTTTSASPRCIWTRRCSACLSIV